MKKIFSILLVMTFVFSAFAVCPVFAAGEAESATPSLGLDLNLDIDLSDIKGTLSSLKDKLFGFVKDIIAKIMSNETYKNIATAIGAVLAFIFLPIIIGLIIVAYVAIGAMVLVAGALVAVVEIFVSIFSGFIPL